MKTTTQTLAVAWSRAGEDIDGHTQAKVHIQRGDVDEDGEYRTLCGITIAAWWEMTYCDIANLFAWAGCKRCERRALRDYAEAQEVSR